jgi:hypothetical protein
MVTYRFPGITFDVLNRWYLACMPEGQQFNGLKWCDVMGSAPNIQRTWQRGDSNDFLLVTVVANDFTSPASVLIDDDRNDTSAPCQK